MLCQNCNEKEANVRYTQIINGVKKEMHLCDACAKDLGIEHLSFNMPIHFSNFLDDMLEETETFIPTIQTPKVISCSKCGMTYDDFIEHGKFGCEECYHTFQSKVDALLKNIHGVNRHIGRNGKRIGTEQTVQKKEGQKQQKENQKEQQKQERLEMLKARLQQEIKEERYEDAAKTRDEIKKIK